MIACESSYWTELGQVIVGALGIGLTFGVVVVLLIKALDRWAS